MLSWFLSSIEFEPSRVYQKTLFDAGIPLTSFITADIQKEITTLRQLGVKFHGDPANIGLITSVLFEDTCGNLINLVQPN